MGDELFVHADVFADGHDQVAAVLRFRRVSERGWHEVRMRARGNDHFDGSFFLEEIGRYVYTVVAWIDHFSTWIDGLKKKFAAGAAGELDFSAGAALIQAASQGAADAHRLNEFRTLLLDPGQPVDLRVEAALSPALKRLMERNDDRKFASEYPRDLPVVVDRERAAFSAWYEMFPRSAAGKKRGHGTFTDVERLLPYIKDLGFDVLYLPPIHPIGRRNRKGKDNRLRAEANDPGSPWAIGSSDGGHTAVHPELGTHEDFRRLVRSARDHGIEVALDMAFQCAPDHPWVTEHPEWFVRRPDGSIQYAENPPKKYEDIYPINFESEDSANLWNALRDVFLFWISHGVQIFRVDNPHTKSFAFWEWVIEDVRRRYPRVLFLAEAFTRPKLMRRLAKLGFSQSYTYFTWRNDPSALREYLTELTTTDMHEYFRPNFWPNTPDILNADLHSGGRPAFLVRVALAATLSSNYGIYGPAYELMEHEPRTDGSEEYKNSEKYEIREWDINNRDSIAPFIRRLNRIRERNPSLQRMAGLRFHNCTNESLLCYSKTSPGGRNVVLVVANMDYLEPQAGWVEFSPPAAGIAREPPFAVHEALSETTYTWTDYWNYVELDPERSPVHIFEVQAHESHEVSI